MTSDEFERSYCERSGITLEEYHNEFNLITLPCNCDHETCDGWAAVDNNQLSIKVHKDLYLR